MVLIMKSLIWLTVENYKERGNTKQQSIILAANELGLTVGEISSTLYNDKPIQFDTKGYKVDPEWLEDVLAISQDCKDFGRRLKYLDAVIDHLDNPSKPIDHNRIQAMRLLVEHLHNELVAITPREVCEKCAEKIDPACPDCNGYKWIA